MSGLDTSIAIAPRTAITAMTHQWTVSRTNCAWSAIQWAIPSSQCCVEDRQGQLSVRCNTTTLTVSITSVLTDQVSLDQPVLFIHFFLKRTFLVAVWHSGNGVGGISTKLLHVGPSYYWDGWPSSNGQTISPGHPQPTQPPILRGTGNDRVPAKVSDDVLRLGIKDKRGPFHMWIHVWVACKTVHVIPH